MTEKKQESTPTVVTWCGKPIEELTREELLEVVRHAADENQRLYKAMGCSYVT